MPLRSIPSLSSLYMVLELDVFIVEVWFGTDDYRRLIALSVRRTRALRIAQIVQRCILAATVPVVFQGRVLAPWREAAASRSSSICSASAAACGISLSEASRLCS